ncbi:acetyltransferase [Flavobacterium cheonanense]|uniref:Acetyltransferase n=1 Tax=Flavobacterium cheonanense TaxID=706183 RepID=A0ABP7W425_9FLAO
MKNLIIIGAGGLAREIYDLAKICSKNETLFKIKGFLSKDDTGIEAMGYPKILSNVIDYSVEENDCFFCAIGDVIVRKRVVETIISKGGEFINLIHPTAIVSPSVKLGIGIGIKSHCVISSDVEIDSFSFLQSSVIMGHDVKIGKFCQINSFAFFAGYVKINNNATINAGAKLLQNVVVEEQAIVGMGSVVISKVKAGTTVFGNPAKRINF